MIQEESKHAPRPHADAATRKALAEKICHAYATGSYTITSCCKVYKLSVRQFRRWVENDPVVADLYNKAKIKFHTENEGELRDIAASNLRKACEGFTYTNIVERTNFDPHGNNLGTTVEKTIRQLPPNVNALKFVITRADKNKAAEEAARPSEERTTMKTLVIMPVGYDDDQDNPNMSEEERKERDRQEQETKERKRREEQEKKELETQARIMQVQSLDEELERIEDELDPIINATQEPQPEPTRPQYHTNFQNPPRVSSLYRDMDEMSYDEDDDYDEEEQIEYERIQQMSQMSPPYINTKGHPAEQPHSPFNPNRNASYNH